MSEQSKQPGMSRATARLIEYSIITLCIAALAMIFQPFSLKLYGIGAGLVVLGGLAFNLVPLCVPGRPLSSVVRAAVTVLVILVIAICLAIGSAYLYGIYLQNQ
jgi:hypothetical protein